MTDKLNYYPEDREVEGFARADALKQAEDLLAALGIERGKHVLMDPRVLTIDTASYEVLLMDLTQADYQAWLKRIYLEPYDAVHDGYLILYDRAVNGVRMLEDGVCLPLALFISRQGVEFVDAFGLYDVERAGEAQPLMTAEDALTAAVPGMIAEEEKSYTIFLDVKDGYLSENAAIERIRLGYRVNRESNHALPIWEFTYQRAMQLKDGTWQTRSLDNHAFLGLIDVNAITGEYIETVQC